MHGSPMRPNIFSSCFIRSFEAVSKMSNPDIAFLTRPAISGPIIDSAGYLVALGKLPDSYTATVKVLRNRYLRRAST